MSDVKSWLKQGADAATTFERVPAARFKNVGARITGKVKGKPQLVPMIDPANGNRKTTASGEEIRQLKVVLTDIEIDPKWTSKVNQPNAKDEDETGDRAVYVKPGHMQASLFEALGLAGAQDILPGGRLAVIYHKDGEAARPGLTPPKLFVFKYEPPANGAVAEDDDEAWAAEEEEPEAEDPDDLPF